MLRAVKVLGPDEPHGQKIDTLILNSEQRRAATGTLTGIRGTPVELDLPSGTSLRMDDALALDTGDVVEIVAEAESLFEVRADIPALARVAWMLGDRHVPVQILPNRLRFRRDAVDERLIGIFGGKVTTIEAPFEPEGGAYASVHEHRAHERHDHHHHHSHDDVAHGHHHAHVHKTR